MKKSVILVLFVLIIFIIITHDIKINGNSITGSCTKVLGHPGQCAETYNPAPSPAPTPSTDCVKELGTGKCAPVGSNSNTGSGDGKWTLKGCCYIEAAQECRDEKYPDQASCQAAYNTYVTQCDTAASSYMARSHYVKGGCTYDGDVQQQTKEQTNEDAKQQCLQSCGLSYVCSWENEQCVKKIRDQELNNAISDEQGTGTEILPEPNTLEGWQEKIEELTGPYSAESRTLAECAEGMQQKVQECSQKEGWAVDNQLSITDFKTGKNYEVQDYRRGGCEGLKDKDPRPFSVDSKSLHTQGATSEAEFQVVCQIACYSWPCKVPETENAIKEGISVPFTQKILNWFKNLF